ncbi:class I SAM-dependent methyltransferase [Knoellia sp. CPCC 206450]|uniref:class I SAM-dependent methyltransferase n=1 Tax=Knoellia tibetensis TaxID=3404798 RepID=UPI003B428BA1
MTDLAPTTVRAVPGEMQPWTDLGPQPGPVRGAAVRAWLEDVLPTGGRWLVVGPHDPELLRGLVTRADSVTALLRSPSDADAVREAVPEGLDLVVGALDGVPETEGPFDVVLATDGLDRVLTPDSEDLSWTERLARVSALAGPDAVLVLGLANEFSLSTVLDARVARDRHGDEEWRPVHSDRRRPCSPAQLVAAVGATGRSVASLWATYGPEARPGLVASVDATDAALADGFVTTMASAASRTTTAPLLALPDEALVSAARAGALSTVADGFLVVCGRTAATTATAYGSAGDASWTGRLAPSEDGPRWTVTAPGGSATEFVDAPTVESELRDLAEREDVPAFRAYAGRLGQWVGSRGSGPALALDRLVRDGEDGFVEVLPRSDEAADVEPPQALAAGWFRFQDRLLHEHRRHPWPPWVLGEDLTAIWSSMSGVTATVEVLESARGFATETAEPRPEIVDVRTARADVEEAVKQLHEAHGHIAGLERTIGFRDKQLLTREEKIRKLHSDLQKVERIRNHPAYQVVRKAAKVRDPRKFAVAVKKRAGKELRKRR